VVQDVQDHWQLSEIIFEHIAFPISSIISYQGSKHSMQRTLEQMPYLGHLTVEWNGVCLTGNKWQNILIDHRSQVRVEEHFIEDSVKLCCSVEMAKFSWNEKHFYG